jgi:hypothetical protein
LIVSLLGTMCSLGSFAARANRKVHLKSILFLILVAVLVLDVTAASAGSSWHTWRSTDRYRGAYTNNTTQGALGYSYQSLQPTPGEIRGLGSRYPEIGVAPGTAGGPTYYPNAMRPIERE